MKRVIRCRTDTNDYTSIDLDLSDMINDKIGIKLFGKEACGQVVLIFGRFKLKHSRAWNLESQ